MYFKPHDDFPVEIMLPTKWYRLARFRLTSPMQVGWVTIPAGFVTDGATVPLLLRWLFPPVGRYFPAAVAHDYLLVTANHWPTANRLFREAVKECRVPTWRRYPMAAGVMVYGYYCRLVEKLIQHTTIV